MINAIWTGIIYFVINILLYLFGSFGRYFFIYRRLAKALQEVPANIPDHAIIQPDVINTLGIDETKSMTLGELRSKSSTVMNRSILMAVVLCAITWFFFPTPFNTYFPILLIIANIATGFGIVGLIPDIGQGDSTTNASESNSVTTGFYIGRIALIILCIGIMAFNYSYGTNTTSNTESTALVETPTEMILPTITIPTPVDVDCRCAVPVPCEARVNTRSLRVRNAPSKNGTIVFGLLLNQGVIILGETEDKLWYFVEFYNKYGWVASEYLEKVELACDLLTFNEQEASKLFKYYDTSTPQLTPTILSTKDMFYVYPRILTNIQAISARSKSFIALHKNGNITVWGEKACGGVVSPVDTNIVDVAAGVSFCMALRDDNTLLIWGSKSSPAANPPQTSNISKISAGYGHALLLTTEGQVFAWGNNSFGQLDVPTFNTTVVDIRAGMDTSAALLKDGSAVVWGQSMASGTYQNVADIALADNHALILYTDGTLDIHGETMGGFELPTNANFVAITADSQAHFALQSDGTVIGRGSYYGMEATPPTQLSNVTAIATGQQQTIVLLNDGSVTQFGETQDRP